MNQGRSLRRRYLEAMGIEVWRLRGGSETAAGAETGNASDSDADTPGHGPVEPDAGSAAGHGHDLNELAIRVAACKDCSLHEHRSQTVFGVGNNNAEWMLIGEAPGREEDRQGIPFVGRAGQLLTAMLQAIDFQRDEVYIANVLKCRPPNNRDPMGEEVVKCEPFLHRQVALVQPKILLALGRFAAQSLLKTTTSIARLRGKVHAYGDTGIPLVVTYHPAYLLRNPIDKRKAWEDLLLARSVFERAQGEIQD